MTRRSLTLTAVLCAGLAVAAVPFIAEATPADPPAAAPTASVNTELTERFGGYGDTAGRWDAMTGLALALPTSPVR